MATDHEVVGSSPTREAKLLRDSQEVRHSAHNRGIEGSSPSPATTEDSSEVERSLDKRWVASSSLAPRTNRLMRELPVPEERQVSQPAFARIAQLVEHLLYTQAVGGSIPSPRTIRELKV